MKLSSIAFFILWMAHTPCWGMLNADGSELRLSEFGLRNIMKARDFQSMNDSLMKLSRLRGLRTRCDQELSRKRVPAGCFEVVKIEWSSGILSDKDAARTREWLNEICHQRIGAVVDISDLSDQHLRHLEGTCHQAALKRREELLYILVDKNPRHLFHHRFEK